MTPTTDDDPTTDPAPPAAESLAPKLIAVGAIAVLVVLFGVLAVGRAVAPPPPPPTPPARSLLDYPGMVSQAKTLCESARKRVDTAVGQKAAGDRDGALRSFQEAMALLDQAQALYERVSNASPGPEYDYIGRDIDRLMLERMTYRKMMGELDR